MTRRIALWSLVGFVVACAWVVFTMSVKPATMLQLEHERYFRSVVDITLPVAMLDHYPLKYFWVVVLNALTYALVGFAIELLWRHSPRPVSIR